MPVDKLPNRTRLEPITYGNTSPTDERTHLRQPPVLAPRPPIEPDRSGQNSRDVAEVVLAAGHGPTVRQRQGRRTTHGPDGRPPGSARGGRVSLKQDSSVSYTQDDIIEPPTKDLGSENGCRDTLSDSDSESVAGLQRRRPPGGLRGGGGGRGR